MTIATGQLAVRIEVAWRACVCFQDSKSSLTCDRTPLFVRGPACRKVLVVSESLWSLLPSSVGVPVFLCECAATRRVLSFRDCWFVVQGVQALHSCARGDSSIEYYLRSVFVCMHSRLEQLRLQCGSLRANCARLTRSIGHSKRTMWEQPLSRYMSIVIWIMFSLAANPLPAVLVFLRNCRGRKLAHYSDERLTRIAENSFLSARLEDLGVICCVGQSHYAKEWKCAKRYLSEQELFEWCERVNTTRGIAPSTFALIQHARLKSGMPRSVSEGIVDGNVRAAARVWALTWRTRWGARLGVLRQSEELSEENARGKVSNSCFMVVSLDPICVPLCGTFS